MSKHTPGPWKPWKTSLARSGVPEYQIHWSDAGECVAEVVHGEPDARLIAAAPDLLEACEVVLSVSDDNAIDEHIIEIVRAAIRRARGHQ